MPAEKPFPTVTQARRQPVKGCRLACFVSMPVFHACFHARSHARSHACFSAVSLPGPCLFLCLPVCPPDKITARPDNHPADCARHVAGSPAFACVAGCLIGRFSACLYDGLAAEAAQTVPMPASSPIATFPCFSLVSRVPAGAKKARRANSSAGRNQGSAPSVSSVRSCLCP